MDGQIDLDQIIDYRSAYAGYIKNATISGSEMRGCCPFHDDSKASFSVNLKKGIWKCHAEGKTGNFITFTAEIEGVDTKEAYKRICERYHIAMPKKDGEPAKKKGRSQRASYSLEQYAHDKRLPIEYLKKAFHLSNGKERSGVQFVRMPYLDEKGQEGEGFRKRFANKHMEFGKGSHVGLYGRQLLPDIRKTGWVILVEGESDTQALNFLGFPTLGVAGASAWRTESKMDLAGLSKIYIHQEPDQGGQTFRDRLVDSLLQTETKEEVYIWSCKETIGEKDPSDVLISMGEEKAKAQIGKALDRAQRIDLRQEAQSRTLPGLPVALKTPPGYLFDRKGIQRVEKTGELLAVCKTPLTITKRIRNLETAEEKVEIAFFRDGQWHQAIFPRSVIFDSRGIKVLADLGCPVTSENAKQLVAWLGALEAENLDAIPVTEAASVFGWQPGNRFIPGHDDGITLDIEANQRAMASAYCQSGTMEGWIAAMAPHRARNRFRFILAAGCAAPLLKILRQRIFFVYNWGGSKGGKTAALKAALSAWGDPDRLMVNFNATQVGLERTAALYCDLPLGIDERQLAGTNQQSLEKIVYMIASGTGRIRGAKSGGIQHMNQWRTVALATGEEPLSGSTSQTGVSTRVLEIYGAPFDSEQAASAMYSSVAEHYGHIGPDFIGRLLRWREEDLRAAFQGIQDYVRDVSQGKNGAHIAGISMVALADRLLSEWYFGDTPEQATQKAKAMAADIMLNQVEQNEQDVNENAVQFVVDWIQMNFRSFSKSNYDPFYGFTENEGASVARVYILPSLLTAELEKAHYSARKTLQHMAEVGLITTLKDKNRKNRYSISKRWNGKVMRVIEFHMNRAMEAVDTPEPQGAIAPPDPAALPEPEQLGIAVPAWVDELTPGPEEEPPPQHPGPDYEQDPLPDGDIFQDRWGTATIQDDVDDPFGDAWV